MEVSELRIGNLFFYGKRLAEISCIFRTHFNCEEHSTRISFGNSIQCNFEPIPLTEEWLLKFGFEKRGVNRTRWTFWKIDLVEDEKGIYSFDESRIYIDIKYVHQLQNIYFALTGEELTFKSE